MKSINSKKARNEIAMLINALECGQIMLAVAESKKAGEQKEKSIVLWQNALREATQKLGDIYGIELPNYYPQRNF